MVLAIGDIPTLVAYKATKAHEGIYSISREGRPIASWTSRDGRCWFEVSPDGMHVALVDVTGESLSIVRRKDGKLESKFAPSHVPFQSIRWLGNSAVEAAGMSFGDSESENKVMVWRLSIAGQARNVGEAKTWGDFATRYEGWDRASALRALPANLRSARSLDTYLYTVGFGRSRALPVRGLAKTLYLDDGAAYVYDWRTQKTTKVSLPSGMEIRYIRFASNEAISISFADRKWRGTYRDHFLGDTEPELSDAFSKEPVESYGCEIVNVRTGATRVFPGVFEAQIAGK